MKRTETQAQKLRRLRKLFAEDRKAQLDMERAIQKRRTERLAAGKSVTYKIG